MAVDQDNGQVDPSVPENYEHLLEDYSHFAPPAADEVVQGTVLGITAKDVIVDFGYKSEGIVPIEQFQSPDRRSHGQARRRGRRHDRPQRTGGRLRAALAHQGRAPAHLGQSGKGFQRSTGALRPRARPRQRRPRGRCRRQGVHARFAGRPAPGAQSGFADRPGYPGQDHQAQPAPRQRGGVAQAGRRRRDQLAQDASPWSTSRKAHRGHGHGQEPHRVRRLHRSGRHRRPAARHRHVLRPHHASFGDAAGGPGSHRQDPQVRPRQGARLAGHQAARAGSLGDGAGALSRGQPRDRPRGQRHRLRRFRGTGSRRGRPDPHQRDDLVAAHEASLQGGQGRAIRWKPWCSRCIPRTAAFRSA